MRSLHRFLSDEGITSHSTRAPAWRRHGSRPVCPRRSPRTEVAGLIDAVTGGEPVDLRDRAVLEVLYGTGVRISELVGLSLADVDLEGALLRAFGKGAKERIVPLGRLARTSLETWFDLGRPALEPERWARRATRRRCSSTPVAAG